MRGGGASMPAADLVARQGPVPDRATVETVSTGATPCRKTFPVRLWRPATLRRTRMMARRRAARMSVGREQTHAVRACVCVCVVQGAACARARVSLA